MPNKESAKSKDVSLRDVVEKNLAKEMSDKKDPKFKRLIKADSEPKKSSSKLKRSLIVRFFSKFKFLLSPITEIRQVTWPDRKTTLKLTTAVVFFSVIFGIMVSLLDWGFEIIFKKVFLHG
jgi:preprotein translocase SecE subunit